MYLIFNNGNFICQDDATHTIDDLKKGYAPLMEIICNSPFKGTPEELANLAVEYLNKKFQINSRFNTIYEDKSKWFVDGRYIKQLVFQICWASL